MRIDDLITLLHSCPDVSIRIRTHTYYLSFTINQRAEGYNSLRRKFGPDSFWVNGPYHAIMTALTPPDYAGKMNLSVPPSRRWRFHPFLHARDGRSLTAFDFF